MKKVLCVILAALMLLPFAACADDPVNTGDVGATQNMGGDEQGGNSGDELFVWSTMLAGYIEGLTAEGMKQENLVIPASCTQFAGAGSSEKLKTIAFENPDTVLEGSAFVGCTALETVQLPANMDEIPSHLFEKCAALKDVEIPASVTKIKSEAFWMCTSLAQITIPNGVESIGRSAFEGCTALKSVEIPDSVTEIDRKAFRACSALTTVTFGKGLQTVGEAAFTECHALSSVKLPEGVKTLEEYAFAFCDAMQEIYLPASLESINNGAISQSHATNVYVVAGSYADTIFAEFLGVENLNKIAQ